MRQIMKDEHSGKEQYIKDMIRKRKITDFRRAADVRRLFPVKAICLLLAFYFILSYTHIGNNSFYEVIGSRIFGGNYGESEAEVVDVKKFTGYTKIELKTDNPEFDHVSVTQFAYIPKPGDRLLVGYKKIDYNADGRSGTALVAYIKNFDAVWDSIYNSDSFFICVILPNLILISFGVFLLNRYIRFGYLKRNGLYIEVRATGNFEKSFVPDYEYPSFVRYYAVLKLEDEGYPDITFRGPAYRVPDKSYVDNGKYVFRIYMCDEKKLYNNSYFVEVLPKKTDDKK